MTAHHYRAFGLRLWSDIELEGLARGDDDRADICIRRAKLDPDALPRLNDDGMVIAGRADGLMRFIVRGGTSIDYDPLPSADRGFLRAILSGELLAVALRQRGHLVLHGSSVARDGRAICFVGGSGWGKSTLARTLSAGAWHLLTDDVLAVTLREAGPAVLPGHGLVKLRDDVASIWESDVAARPHAHGHTDRRAYLEPVDGMAPPVPVAKVYLLEAASAPTTRVEEIPESRAVPELLRHTRVTQLIRAPGFAATHLQQCAELATRAPVALLHRERMLDRLPDLVGVIEADLAMERGGS